MMMDRAQRHIPPVIPSTSTTLSTGFVEGPHRSIDMAFRPPSNRNANTFGSKCLRNRQPNAV